MKKIALLFCHLVFWIFTAISTPYIFDTAFFIITRAIQHPEPSGPFHTYHYEIDYPAVLIVIAIGACIFYSSYFSLHFFLRRPVRFIGILLFYIVSGLIISLPADLFSEQAGWDLGPIMYFNLCGFLFKACVEWIKDRKIRLELEKDRETSQLELLKSKIDPHFLFNNLNNIDVFIQEDPKQASEYLKKLSDILRFMLYEANTQKIPLSKELSYIHQYIELQKIRTSNLNFVKFELNGDASDKYISPMILIHFIENAFKFAGNKKIEHAVVLRFDIATKRLSFFCKNHISAVKELNQETKGLGIQLLNKKLDLLYKKEYKLNTSGENNWYSVNLEIPLDDH